ncbi:hypothetical protein [Roseateles terrae]|uniref:Uncharacterized protein n=1 Tax=Roseateles terrae TaxID=431060 RepID=A0ABR6GWR6_9BURK|nr:hypothetical protein [Roseateles terrae]MBB3196556.1 hypothetical protein [Roseateles terrae]OWQ84821.1 hypothetical protein CDN98_17280 [Roseateles terrae]
MISPAVVVPLACHQGASPDSSASSSSSTLSAPSPSRCDSPGGPELDVETLWQRYNQRPFPAPQGVHDLSSVLYALLTALRDRDGPSQDRQLHEIAMLLSRCSRLVLPPDPGIRQMAHTCRARLNAMLARGGTEGSRTPGVEAALDEFAVHFNNALGAPDAQERPVMIVKSVPLKEPLLTCRAAVTGLTLRTPQPLMDTLLASTPMPSPPVPREGDRVPCQPLLCLSTARGRLRIEVTPQGDRDWRADGSRLREALNGLDGTLMLSLAAGRCLEDALHHFNRGADPRLRLTMAPGLSDAIRRAELQVQPGSCQECILWFDYAGLVTPGALDQRIDGPGALDHLNACRRLVQDAAHAEVNELLPDLPAPYNQFRASLVLGCAVQLCLEAAGRSRTQPTEFDFVVPVHEVTARMTPTEITLLQAILASLRWKIAGLDLSAMDRPAVWKPAPTYVSMDRGSPMGCVVVRTFPTLAAARAAAPEPQVDPADDGWGETLPAPVRRRMSEEFGDALSEAFDPSMTEGPTEATAHWLEDWSD